MACKIIKGHQYYYKSVWENGRARTRYYGGGEGSLLVAAVEEIDQQERAEARAEERAERAAAEALERETREAFDSVERLFRAAMKALGYHQHARGQWRKRRMKAIEDNKAAGKALTTEQANELAQKARAGDKVAMKEFKRWLETDGRWFQPTMDEIGSPRVRAEDAAFDQFAGAGDLLVNYAAQTKYRDVRRTLSRPNMSALESMLVNRVVYTWFRVWRLEAWDVSAGGGTIQQAKYRLAALDAAHRRHLTAVKALAVIRRLDVSALTVTLSKTEAVTLSAPAPEPERPK